MPPILDLLLFWRRKPPVVEQMENRSKEMEAKLAEMERKIDPLRSMVHEMRNAEFWRQ